MPKQLIQAAIIEAAGTPKGHCQLMHVIIVLIMVFFLGKQCLDVDLMWDKVSVEMVEQVKAKIDLCRK
jgi:hypothetical protein